MTKKRPFGITLLALLAAVAAIIAIIHTLQMLHLFPISGPFGEFKFFTFDLFGALLWGLLAIIYIWVARMLWNLDPQGWLFVVVLAALNLILAIISIFGQSSFQAMLPSILINGLILLYGLLPGTKAAFSIPPAGSAAASPASAKRDMGMQAVPEKAPAAAAAVVAADRSMSMEEVPEDLAVEEEADLDFEEEIDEIFEPEMEAEPAVLAGAAAVLDDEEEVDEVFEPEMEAEPAVLAGAAAVLDDEEEVDEVFEPEMEAEPAVLAGAAAVLDDEEEVDEIFEPEMEAEPAVLAGAAAVLDDEDEVDEVFEPEMEAEPAVLAGAAAVRTAGEEVEMAEASEMEAEAEDLGGRMVTGSSALTHDLSYIEGIDNVDAGKLKEAGVDSPQSLLERGATPKGRKELADQTGISSLLILKWVNHVDLFRIKGLGAEYAELLEASGVDTVPELAQRNPRNLYQKVIEVNAQQHLVQKAPSQAQIESWVSQAKDLPRVIIY